MSTNIIVRKRIGRLFAIIAAILFLLIARLSFIQFFKGEELQKKALDNRLREVPVEAKRGIIYDRSGKELAVSISADSVGVFPAEVKKAEKYNPNIANEIAEKLSKIIEIPKDDVYKKITKKSSFVWIKRKIAFEAGPKIKKLSLPGIEVYEESQRYYPNNSLASHILGFAGIDNQGLEGLEITYDRELKGSSGKIVMEFDAKGRQIPEAMHKYISPVDGNNIYLTIDETIQYVAEKELDKIMQQTKAKSATIICMDPKTGGILALGSRPNYDPNNYKKYSSKNWRNIAVSNAYEPGSTFKVVTTAAVLEENVVSLNEHFYCPGFEKVQDRIIKCHKREGHGDETFVEGVQNSCNPVFIKVGLRLEEKKKGLFYDYIKAFGFGKITDIELQGEASGIMIKQENIKPVNIATISMGQSIAVTPIQLIRAVSAVANDGKLMKPLLVKEIRDKDGNLVKINKPVVEKQVVSKETANQTCSILESVVSDGTGRTAYIPGYRVGGKTGTAQKAGPGGYMQGKYVSSFIGLAPSNDPRVVTLVIIDEPEGVYYGGVIAAPAFKEVTTAALRYLGVAPQYNEKEKEEESIKLTTVPNITDLLVVQAQKILKAKGLVPEVKGEGLFVTKQTPKDSAKVKEGTKVILYTGNRKVENGKLAVPDLRGLRVTEVAKLIESLGLILEVDGSGVAVSQQPIVGTYVSKGTKIIVNFKEKAP